MSVEPGYLTTHVLDTANGCPASGMRVDLRRSDGEIIGSFTTNEDGRVDGPLLEGEAFVADSYELTFCVGAYFKSRGSDSPNPMFLDVVPVWFSVSDPDEHYHVPLLVSPYSYSTYRGS